MLNGVGEFGGGCGMTGTVIWYHVDLSLQA